MSFFDRVIAKPIGELFIASPASGYDLVFRHPDQAIPAYAKVTVRTDEVALFFEQGQLAGILEAGTYSLVTSNIPFLGNLLVTPLTGGNHFLTEIFFVRTSEIIHRAQVARLGTFTDVASRNVVGLGYLASVTLQVTNAAMLVTTLAGQRTMAGATVAALVDARLTSVLASLVGRLAAGEGILQIASNQFSDELGAHVAERAAEAFAPHGLRIVRCVELRLELDPASEQLLRAHGQRLAELSLEREAAQLAEQPGYATMHLVKGQRSLLEGMGAGASLGGSFGGIGFGMALGFSGLVGQGLPSVFSGRALPSASGAGPAPRLAPVTTASARYYLRGDRGVEGPYSPRQLVLRAAGCGLDLESTLVRPETGGDWLDASSIVAIENEFARRGVRAMEAPRGGAPPGVETFERSLEMALADAVLSEEELAILVTLCQAAGLATDVAAARAYVVRRTKALGCASPSP